ncbi:zinc-binding dehydrogenase [Pseudomonas graminis]
MQALVFDKTGTADVLYLHEAADPVAARGELLVAVSAAGLNFADIYRRQGRYPLAGHSPYIAGYEGAGRVIAVGENVSGWKIGDRVGFADVPLAHASHIRVPVDHAIRLPEWLSETDAAAVLLQGLTADYLLHDVLPLRAGMHVAVLAAAGGVGRLLLQMLKYQGIHTFAVASSQEKQNTCLQLGASAAADYDNWHEQLRTWQPQGCDVVFDSVGTTLTTSLDALKDGGRVVLFGMSGGALSDFDPSRLQLHSHGILGADLWTYLTSGEERQRRADRLFSLFEAGHLALPPVTAFSLSAGAEAHRLLETRSFSGKIILVP